jgi:hypothetical protein
MTKSTMVAKGAGSEPVLRTFEHVDGRPPELEWGRWTFQAIPELTLYGGSICYVIKIVVHGDQDEGQRGMFGELSTGIGMSLTEAIEAARGLRMTVISDHMEDGDEDNCCYERTIDFGPLAEAAGRGVLDAVKAEAQFIRKHVEHLPVDPKLEELEAEVLRLRQSNAERQAMLETYGKMIAELLPGASASGEPVEHARKFATMMVRKYLGLPTLGELVQRGVPITTEVTESDREMRLVSMKTHFGAERGCVYDAVFLRT